MLTSSLTLASLAAVVLGQDADSSPCLEYTMLTTIIDGASTDYGAEVQTTTLSETLTFVTTVANYTSTTTLTHTPDAHAVTQTTGTTTGVDPTATTYTFECTTNSTVSVEYTSAEYTGSFSTSSLRTTCMPYASTERVYASGTTTPMPTETVYDSTWNTEYTLDVSTMWLSGLVETPTVTVQVDRTVLVPGTTTSADEIECYPSATTATASTHTTQSIACAPSNLLQLGGVTDQSADEYSFEDAATDASACCQLCVDDDNCTAMTYVDIVNKPYGICNIYNGTSSCGFAAAAEGGNRI